MRVGALAFTFILAFYGQHCILLIRSQRLPRIHTVQESLRGAVMGTTGGAHMTPHRPIQDRNYGAH